MVVYFDDSLVVMFGLDTGGDSYFLMGYLQGTLIHGYYYFRILEFKNFTGVNRSKK